MQEPLSSPGEVLGKFPDLARARDLYIELFKNRSPLVNLGYTNAQIAFASPALHLLEGPGKVMTYKHPPYLFFDDPQNKNVLSAEIYYLPLGDGFILRTKKDETLRFEKGMSPEDRLSRIFLPEPGAIFQDLPFEVAQIALFDESANLTDLDYLVKQLHGHYLETSHSIKQKGKISKLAKSLGIIGTYEAAWVDEKTKHEFVIKLEIPEEKYIGPSFMAFKRLRSISGPQGSVTPFGKKPTNEGKVTRILSTEKPRVFKGQLALNNVNI